MGLKDKWVDKINGVDINSADDINQVAHAVIELEENGAVDGENGATFTPSVSDEGVISWTNDKGLDNPTPVNIKGNTGDKGDPFTYEDFTAEQLAALKGDKGDKGDKGAAGKDGENGKDGKDGTSVTVSNVTTSSADGGSNVVTFSDGKTVTIKNGSKGSKGDTGDKGDKGDKGDTGATGATGAAGKDGADGATAEQVIAAMPKETWTFTLEDGSTVQKVVPLV